MRKPSTSKPMAAGEAPGKPRSYDSPLRKDQADQTRARILAAGSELALGLKIWDWRDLTVAAIAERAGVSERTIYRHFATERQLHEAVMSRLEEDVGVSYENVGMDDLVEVAGRGFALLPSLTPSSVRARARNEALLVRGQRRRDALRLAIDAEMTAWPPLDRQMAAGVLDLLWNVPAFERLIGAWELDKDHATQAIGWAIGIIVGSIREGRRPSASGDKNGSEETP